MELEEVGTWQEYALRWMENHPDFKLAGTAVLPTPEQIRLYEEAAWRGRMEARLDAIENRLLNLELHVSLHEVKLGEDDDAN